MFTLSREALLFLPRMGSLCVFTAFNSLVNNAVLLLVSYLNAYILLLKLVEMG